MSDQDQRKGREPDFRCKQDEGLIYGLSPNCYGSMENDLIYFMQIRRKSKLGAYDDQQQSKLRVSLCRKEPQHFAAAQCNAGY